MNKDLIETPRFICSLGDEVLLKGRIVGFDVDENKCVESAVRLEYGQTLNVPNCNIYTKNNIIDEPEKIKIPQFVAEYIEFKKKNNFHVYGAMRTIEDHYDKKVPGWFYEGNVEKFCLAWILGYEVEEEKRYYIRLKGVDENYNFLNFIKHLNAWVLAEIKTDKKFRTTHTRKELEDANFGWVFDCPGIEIEEVTE